MSGAPEKNERTPYAYTLDYATSNRTCVMETVSGVTREITNTYDALNRQIVSTYSTGEAFTYHYDAVGNRVAMTSTTPLSGTVVTDYTFDAANRLTTRAAMRQMHLSARAYHRILKVSRTMGESSPSDLEGAEGIQTHHLAETVFIEQVILNIWPHNDL